MRYFASGSNHQGEIEGLAAVGMNIGVAAQEVNDAAVVALLAVPAGVSVFVDSGAFSEVLFDPAPRIAFPISDAEWERRLGLYAFLAAGLGSQLYPVAPDCVAHQRESLARLERYADEVRALRAAGANVIVPIQKGEMSMAAFDARAVEILGFDDFVRGVPMKKDATSVEDLVDFVVGAGVKRLHLLGIGPKSPKWDDVVDALAAAAPALDVSADSVWLKSLVGKSNGAGGAPRAWTKVQDEMWANELAPRAFHDDAIDYSDNVLDGLNEWAGPAERRRLADELGAAGLLRAADVRSFRKDPHGWFCAGDDRVNDWSMAVVDGAWQRHYFAEIVVERKRESIIRMVPRGQLGLDL